MSTEDKKNLAGVSGPDINGEAEPDVLDDLADTDKIGDAIDRHLAAGFDGIAMLEFPVKNDPEGPAIAAAYIVTGKENVAAFNEFVDALDFTDVEEGSDESPE